MIESFDWTHGIRVDKVKDFSRLYARLPICLFNAKTKMAQLRLKDVEDYAKYFQQTTKGILL
jgi:hypothetical protein